MVRMVTPLRYHNKTVGGALQAYGAPNIRQPMFVWQAWRRGSHALTASSGAGCSVRLVRGVACRTQRSRECRCWGGGGGGGGGGNVHQQKRASAACHLERPPVLVPRTARSACVRTVLPAGTSTLVALHHNRRMAPQPAGVCGKAQSYRRQLPAVVGA